MKPFDLSQEDAKAILHEMIIPQVIGDVFPQAIQEAFILGGQPGSGKSAFAREILKSNSQVVFVNGDDLRAYHPKYYFYLKDDDIEAADLTQAVCNFWIESLIQECVSRRVNFIVEGTMRRKEVPLATAKMLKENQYNVHLVIISAPYQLSLRSLGSRYFELKRLGMPARYTKKESHDEAFCNLENTLKALLETDLFEKYYVCNRSTEGFQEEIFQKSQKEEVIKAFLRGRREKLVEDEYVEMCQKEQEKLVNFR
jgi:adenylate kinase family enzyme